MFSGSCFLAVTVMCGVLSQVHAVHNCTSTQFYKDVTVNYIVHIEFIPCTATTCKAVFAHFR